MDTTATIDRVRHVGAVRSDGTAHRAAVESALRDVAAVRAWCDSSEAGLAALLAAQVSFPEKSIAEATRTTVATAHRTLDRARTLESLAPFAEALDDGAITAGHVDAITQVAAGLERVQRSELLDRCERLVDIAEHATVSQWRDRVRSEARRIEADDGMERLERQRRATSLRTWVDAEGMWNLRGRIDPVTGVSIAARLDAAVETLFAERTPSTCPSDPVERQHHLRALALCRLVEGSGAGSRPGRSEFVVVIDADRTDHAASGVVDGVDWPIPVEVPRRVLAELMEGADVTTVVVRNGIVLHAPGTLDLGRTTRLANRAQRRALRGLYRCCAIPGCAVAYDRCKLHHVVWWRHGGRTDLDNLLPICTVHHTRVHHHGWTLTLGPNRQLTITLPDGSTMSTGPPRRDAA